MLIFLIPHPPFAAVSYNRWHYESFFGYTSPLYTQRLPYGLLGNPDMYEDISLPSLTRNGRIIYRRCHRDFLYG